jgi:iron complex outermembrane receptor protein
MRCPHALKAVSGRIVALVWFAAGALQSTAGWTRDADEEVVLGEVVITATRSPTFMRDEPLRVEALPAEEIEENLTIQPGNVSKLLKELPGVHVQSSAPALGGATMQLRGMPGRNTLILTDGLPLLGTEPDAFGLLQIPPLDLATAELIKGAVSALYGGSALGGVLNLVSRTPDSESSFLANVTSRGGRDLLGFLTAKGDSPWSGTLIAGAHDQSRQDVNRDGWADLADSRRYSLRPRIWWQGTRGDSLLLTAGAMDEVRRGGTMPGQTLPGGADFPEELRTRRLDLGAVSHWIVGDQRYLDGRYSLTSSDRNRTFGSRRSDSRQTTAYVEEALSGTHRNHRWVLGAAFEHDQLSAADTPGMSYTYSVPSVFGQDTYAPAPWISVAGSARVDVHNEYGTFLSSRLSALFRGPGGPWSLRASVGNGFTVPTPFVDEAAATWLGALLPLQGLRAERATNASLDLGWMDGGWNLNVGMFTSEVRHALQVVPRPNDRLELVNSSGPRRAPGVEVLVGYVNGPLHAMASWSDIHATEVDAAGVRHDAFMVPRQTATLDAILESEQRGRIGIELEYTGRQALDDNSYRRTSPGYWQLNILAELRFGGFGIFVNAVNLTDVRQTKYDPLIRPFPGPGGDPITDVWAPLDGRVFNLGIRAEL